jgi:hypothetical protein
VEVMVVATDALMLEWNVVKWMDLKEAPTITNPTVTFNSVFVSIIVPVMMTVTMIVLLVVPLIVVAASNVLLILIVLLLTGEMSNSPSLNALLQLLLVFKGALLTLIAPVKPLHAHGPLVSVLSVYSTVIAV